MDAQLHIIIRNSLALSKYPNTHIRTHTHKFTGLPVQWLESEMMFHILYIDILVWPSLLNKTSSNVQVVQVKSNLHNRPLRLQLSGETRHRYQKKKTKKKMFIFQPKYYSPPNKTTNTHKLHLISDDKCSFFIWGNIQKHRIFNSIKCNFIGKNLNTPPMPYSVL